MQLLLVSAAHASGETARQLTVGLGFECLLDVRLDVVVGMDGAGTVRGWTVKGCVAGWFLGFQFGG